MVFGAVITSCLVSFVADIVIVAIEGHVMQVSFV
jgi:hypothetical protein